MHWCGGKMFLEGKRDAWLLGRLLRSGLGVHQWNAGDERIFLLSKLRKDYRMNLYEEARTIVAAYEAKYGRIQVVLRESTGPIKKRVIKGLRVFTAEHRRKLREANTGKKRKVAA